MRLHIERLEQRRLLAIALLADLNPDAGSSSPEAGVLWGGRLFFSAEDAEHGRELWVTDGTAAGTRLFKDINPGPSGSDPANFTLHGQTLYFTADDGEHGVELFASGGAADSTRLVADVNPGSEDSAPTNLTPFGQRLFFTAATPGEGREPYFTDGTAEGTSLLVDVHPGPASGAWQFHSYDDPAVLGDTLYFLGSSPEHGSEVWRTRGDPASTARVTDINPGAGNAVPGHLTVVGPRVYFSAFAPSDGYELWAIQGTGDAGSAYRVRNLASPPLGGSPRSLQELNGVLLFNAFGSSGLELYRSDGTALGTTLVKEINPEGHSQQYDFVRVGDQYYFNAENAAGGTELWVTDGTEAGTYQVADLWPGSAGSVPRPGLAAGTEPGSAYFFAAYPSHEVGYELFRTTGEPSTTTLFGDLNPIGGSEPTPVGVVNGHVLFAVTTPDRGRELWRIAAPTPDAGGPYAITNWPRLTLDASASTDPDPAEMLTYTWDLDGDGVFGETGGAAGRGDELGASPVFYAGGAPQVRQFTVSLRAANSAGLSAVTTTIIDVVAPAVNAGPDRNAVMGNLFSATGSFSDPGGSGWTATVDYGDGDGPQPLALNPDGTYSLSHNYTAGGVYAVTVRVSGAGGTAGSDSFNVNVRGPLLQGTNLNDALALRFDADAGALHFYENVAFDGPASFSIPLALIDAVQISAGSGADTLTIFGTPSDDVIDINDARILFNGLPLSFSGLDKVVTFEVGDGDDALTVSPGASISPTFKAGAGINTFNALSGTHTFGPETDPAATPLHVSASGSGTILVLTASRTLASLALADGARLWSSSQFPLVLRTSSFSLAGGARLDLRRDSIIVQSTPDQRDADLARIAGYASALGGPALLHSSAEARGAPHTGVAVILNDDGSGAPILQTFGGQAVDENSILIKYTYDGDADLDGRISIADYFLIDAGRALRKGGYRNGDFNYSGGAGDADDYMLIDRAFLSQGTPLSADPAPLPPPSPSDDDDNPDDDEEDDLLA